MFKRIPTKYGGGYVCISTRIASPRHKREKGWAGYAEWVGEFKRGSYYEPKLSTAAFKRTAKA